MPISKWRSRLGRVILSLINPANAIAVVSGVVVNSIRYVFNRTGATDVTHFGITPEHADALGRKKFTVNQNVDRLTKFADRRLLQEAASGFEKVPTPSQTLKSKGLIKTLLKTGLKAVPLIGTVLGLGDTVSAYGMGIRNPIDLLTAYNISPEAALESKQYREDPEFRKKSIAELPIIQTEDFTSYFNGGIVSLKGVKK